MHTVYIVMTTYLQLKRTEGYAKPISTSFYHKLDLQYDIERFDSITIIAHRSDEVAELTKIRGFIQVNKPKRVDEDFNSIQGVQNSRW